MKEVLRMCIACREHKDKRGMTRVVKAMDGTIELDLSGKKAGRGAYICSEKCLDKCQRAKLLNRAFKTQVSIEVYKNLLHVYTSESSNLNGK